MTYDTTTFITYEHLACALINDDYQGLSEEDKTLVEEIKNEYGLAGKIVSCSEESFFKWLPDFGKLGGTCLEYTVLFDKHIPKEIEA